MVRFITLLLMLTVTVPVFAIEMKRTEIIAPDGGKVSVGIAIPEGTGPFPGVIIQRGAGGSLDKFEKTLVKFASEGLVCVAIDASVSRNDINYAADRIRTASEALAGMKEIIPAKIGVWGFSNGGAAALMYAAKKSPPALVTYGAMYERASDSLSKISSQVLVLHGSEDTTSNARFVKDYFEEISKNNKTAKLKVFDGKGHDWDMDVMTESIAFFKEKLK